MKNTSIRKLSLAGAAAVGALGIVGGSLVYAQTPTATPIAPSTQEERAAQQDAYLSALAGNLGVTADALEAALQKTSLDTIAQLEADGTITAERAAELRERVAEDAAAGRYHFGIGGPGMGKGGPHGGGHGFAIHPGGNEALAEYLGITTEELRSERAGGSSLAEIAASHGKSRDELEAFLEGEAKADLDEAVAAGRLTQAEADAMLEKHAASLDDIIDNVGGPVFRGGRGPMGHPGVPGVGGIN